MYGSGARSFGLREKLGAPPTFFFHADQIPGANAATVVGSSFPCLGIPINASQPDAPVIGASSFTGSKRCLEFTTTKHLRCDALAGAYTTMATNFLFVCSVMFVNTANQRTILDYGLNGSSARYLDHYLDGASDQFGWYYQNSGGFVADGTTPAVTMTAATIFAFQRTASAWSAFELTSGGENRLTNAKAAAKTGAVSFDRGVIGAEWQTSTTGNALGNTGTAKIRSMLIGHGLPTLSATDLSSLLVHFNTKLDCPVG